ncbi:uncharacterized protein G2W53_025728 [Senna tora]|uniref:Uncharacterized protein n=1 Tax=Senna tora TaxID=362788 RepID=A0A834TDR5_9FABA|nr:uncharacterized protein G2W53_025728 [Senna tora]
MKNGYDEKLAEEFSGLGINQQHGEQHNQPHDRFNPSSNNNDGLYQVVKAVEAAEATIRQQAEENNRLRSELQRKIQELEKYNQDESTDQRPRPFAPWSEQGNGSYESYQSVPSSGNQEDMLSRSNAEDHAVNSRTDGMLRVHPNDQKLPADSIGPSQLSSPSTRSASPNRHVIEGDYEPRLNSMGEGLMPMNDMNNSNSLWKQDLSNKIREHEEEIMQLRKHLANYSIKEAQIRNEKYVLEKRIAYMRLAFDQQQQDLVDAASKALSYRQDIIEENIRLTYALQDAQLERSTFIQSLLPLLAEYSLQPPAPDAQSIVSNVKVLFKHLQEKLLLTESKLNESQYQLVPWRSDMNHANFASQSPPHPVGAALVTSNKNGLELIPRTLYPQVKSPVSVDGLTGTEWDVLGGHQSGWDGGVVKNADPDVLGRFSPLESRNSSTSDHIASQPVINQGGSHPGRYRDEMSNKQVTFRDPVSSSSEVDDPDGNGNLNERETTANWSSGNSPSRNTDDPSSSYPYLQPVYEEPSSSFSEAADDDRLPGIEGLQISGEALPGKELQACGYSINGTTSCNFEWIRHLEDGSVNYIDGAKQPTYLVTADDVDTYLAIEVQPLDDRKRKGEPVKVFANDNKKITCDPEMQSSIERTLYSGHASYKVSLSTGYLDIWEPATLAIKKEGYSIKCSGPSGVVVTEKFSPSINVIIPYGHVSEFILICSNGDEHLLRAENGSADAIGSRDTIVLTLRLFILRV